MLRSLMPHWTVTFLLLLAAGAAGVVLASQPALHDPNTMTAIGSYAAGDLGESHTFGYEAQLWRAGTGLLGSSSCRTARAGNPPSASLAR